MLKLRSIQKVDFPNSCNFFSNFGRLSKHMYWCSNSEVYLKQTLNIDVFILETQKYAWSRFSELMYLSLNSEVYLKETFNIDVFILKLWSILKVDFLNLWICLQKQKYIWSPSPKKKYTSFQKKSRSINNVLLKYKQSAFLFFFCFYTSFILLFRKFT